MNQEIIGKVWVHEVNCFQSADVEFETCYYERGNVGPEDHTSVDDGGIWLTEELLKYAGKKVKITIEVLE